MQNNLPTNPAVQVQASNSSGSILIPKINPELTNKMKRNKKLTKIALITLSVIVVVLVLVVTPLTIFGLRAKAAYEKLKPLTSSVGFTDVKKIKENSQTVKNEVSDLNTSYKLISWMRIFPWAGGYVADLGHGLKGAQYSLDAFESGFMAVEPYLSVLGYDSSDSGEKTAQERIDIVVKAIPELTTKIDDVSKKLQNARIEFDQIDPNRYPEKYKNVEVRNKIMQFLNLFDQVVNYTSTSKPVLEAAPYLLGTESPRNYLVLFQNDKELRPTGGFMTAYSIMKVDKAKFEPVDSADIYHLDAKYKPVLPAPKPIVDMIKGPYVLSQNIRLRDMNYSPDFPTSMKLFTEEVDKVGLPEVDGIIGMDTQVLVNILNVLGEIGVSGFGNFSTKNDSRCNCPQVIYELESFADTEGPIVWDPNTGKIVYTPPNYDNRKKIIGPLMNSILANALAQPKEKMPALIDAVFKSLMEKHVLFYVYDEKAQKSLEDFGVAGKILDYQGDYLHISDSNLGGRKSNLYVTQEVHQEIETDRTGMITKTVTITYKNSEKHDGWLNSVLPNWVRIYVPKGAQLVTSEGLEQKYDVYEELNKTVFSGNFKLRPEGVSKITFKYTLPFKAAGEYKMLIQKQPGTDMPLYTVSKGFAEEEFVLNQDREIRVK